MSNLYLIPKPIATPSSTSRRSNSDVVVCVREGSVETAKLTFLSKILAAAGLKSDQYSLIRTSNSLPMSLGLHGDIEDAKSLLIFGLEPKKLGIQCDLPLYEIIELGKLRILRAPALAELELDQVAKKQLWSAIKSLFKL